jgi:uncharacterized protein
VTIAYLDSSAIVKLIVPEVGSRALSTAVNGFDDAVTSEIAVVEVTRAIQRTGLDQRFGRTDDVLRRLILLAVDAEVIALARHLEPADLGTLDAVHVASALSLGLDDLTFVGYDRRQLTAAHVAGLAVASPG